MAENDQISYNDFKQNIRRIAVIGVKKATVVDMKNRLSAYLDELADGAGPVVITKRGKPVAALVSIQDLESIKSRRQVQGLASIVGKWKGFEEIAPDVMRAYASRNRNAGRKVIG